MSRSFLRQIPKDANKLTRSWCLTYYWTETIIVGGIEHRVHVVAHDNLWSGFGAPDDPKERQGPAFFLDYPGYSSICNARCRTLNKARKQFVQCIKKTIDRDDDIR